ncbi:OLC1v1024170C1 [Oldenlandia corymbosa var. corymbosa]|uniref:OLC1v1024170C1 n=1 Tax=Oldenlandia corymbosa var. corymbosa TaxID=529605 RepID=A0AAV1C1L5_OLDCO|nr:OLC1v1024170C1 [Oldenlandia corymbosa var. corymbosa]
MISPIFLIFAFFSLPFPSSSQQQQLLDSLHGPLTNFESCISTESQARVENITYNFWSPQYFPILEQSIRNLRFNSSKTPKPFYIITPENGHHVRGAILCCKKYNLEMRIRGAGHDYEAFDVVRTPEEGATRAVSKWQELANVLPKEIVIRALITSKTTSSGEQTINVAFEGLYLGRAKKLMKLMETHFPELKLKRKECKEMSWVNTTLFFNLHEGQKFSLNDLLNTKHYRRSFYKAKSDYVTLPIREDMLEAIFDVVKQGGTNSGVMQFQPYGGRVSEIPADATPFPHRDGTLYNIHYIVGWHDESDDRVIDQRLDWLYKIYDFMADYVEKPRTAYQNYRDLDLGKNEYADEKYSEAWSTWGRMYFKDNFKRLAQIKHRVDPDNFFRHEQILLSDSIKATYGGGAPVFDTDGDQLRRGQSYYIVSAGWSRLRAGGLKPYTGRGSTCPFQIVQAFNLRSDGVPVAFSPVDPQDLLVQSDSDQNIVFEDFPSAVRCSESNVWKVDFGQSQSSPAANSTAPVLVTTGGVEGNPGPNTLPNWFKIQEYEDAYIIQYCPSASLCGATPCRDSLVCENIGVSVVNGKRVLSLSRQPLKVAFKRVKRCATLVATN